jgi:hypothetical protein
VCGKKDVECFRDSLPGTVLCFALSGTEINEPTTERSNRPGDPVWAGERAVMSEESCREPSGVTQPPHRFEKSPDLVPTWNGLGRQLRRTPQAHPHAIQDIFSRWGRQKVWSSIDRCGLTNAPLNENRDPAAALGDAVLCTRGRVSPTIGGSNTFLRYPLGRQPFMPPSELRGDLFGERLRRGLRLVSW